MKRASELRQRADSYRRLKKQITDARTVKALCELAGELEMTAAELERRHHIRQRAHEIWMARGCPQGRDIEHWLMAEQELAESSTDSGRSEQGWDPPGHGAVRH